jgi:hypothetical protein
VIEGMSASSSLGYSSDVESGRRPGVRKLLRRPADLVLPDRKTVEVRLHDLRMDGVAVVAPVNLRQAFLCEVKFRLPWSRGGHGAVAARAKVAHSILSSRQGGFLIGLDFIDIDEGSLGAISRYMSA